MPKIATLMTVRSRYLASPTGVGQPDCSATATASGTAAATVSASSTVTSGRLAIARTCSSSSSPTEIGPRRTWNVLVPIMLDRERAAHVRVHPLNDGDDDDQEGDGDEDAEEGKEGPELAGPDRLDRQAEGLGEGHGCKYSNRT